jgi:hypothetical protein
MRRTYWQKRFLSSKIERTQGGVNSYLDLYRMKRLDRLSGVSWQLLPKRQPKDARRSNRY